MNYLILYESCQIVKGATRSLIYDFQRSRSQFIPNELSDLLSMGRNLDFNHLIESISDNEKRRSFIESVDYLIKEEFAFFTPEPNKFPQINKEWDYPAEITNAIIELGNLDALLILQLIDQLEELGCQHIEFRAFKNIENELLLNILNHTSKSKIISLDFLLHHKNFDEHEINNVLDTYPRIRHITFHSSMEDHWCTSKSKHFGNVYLLKKSITSSNFCGVIDPSIFVMNIDFYMESLNHNSCLNRKVGIDIDGKIKNCPSMNTVYGIFPQDDIKDTIRKKEFQQLWKVTKDDIEVCNECEFRLMCHDCRAFRTEKENMYSKPSKCGYNPYSGIWDKESLNQLRKLEPK